MAGWILSNCLLLLVIIAITASARHRPARHLVFFITISLLGGTRRWRCKHRPRATGSVENPGRRGKARRRVAVRSRKHGWKTGGGIAIFGRRCWLGLVAAESVDFFLHLCQLECFPSLLLIQFLHFKLKTATLFANPFIFQLFLLNLSSKLVSLARDSNSCADACAARLQKRLGRGCGTGAAWRKAKISLDDIPIGPYALPVLQRVSQRRTSNKAGGDVSVPATK